MCGIVGFYDLKSSFDEVQRETCLKKMSEQLSHRGPDNLGMWFDNKFGLGLGHTRLSILDTSDFGNQPMSSHSGRYVLIFNGEIYNHLEIRNSILKKNKIPWKSSSDTETLVNCFDFFGIKKTLQMSVGMFAFAVWDTKDKILTLGRDRFGEKPLYYGYSYLGDPSSFFFSSELKALKVHPNFRSKIDINSLNLYLKFNNVTGTNSIYEGIKKLKPGSLLSLDLKRNKQTEEIYWSHDNDLPTNKTAYKSEADVVNIFEGLLEKSINNQMISDVPLGGFLSGGIDSSTIVALMQKNSSDPIKSFTIGFESEEHDESVHSRKIANYLGTDHKEVIITHNEARDVIPILPSIYDEPFADSSQIPTFLVSKIAKEKVSVALSGDGGDELFCGYNRYNFVEKWKRFNSIPYPIRLTISKFLLSISRENLSLFKNFVPNINNIENFGDKIHKGAYALNSRNIYDLYISLISYWKNPNEVILEQSNPVNYLNKLSSKFKNLLDEEKFMLLDSLNYLVDDILVKVDRAAMSVSLETRMPFLDHNLQEFVWSLPQSFKVRRQGAKRLDKWLLKKILYKYVPQKFFERPKKGFEIPINEWLKGPLKEWANDLLDERKIKDQGYFNHKIINKYWKKHLSGKIDYKSEIWTILMFQAWLENDIKN
tara:strand:+ start:4441 stop:6402 length:1962 start_codon:yes stop_codon:yes gene_type:complete